VSGALWVGIGALPTWPAWIAIGAGAALAAAPFWFPRAS
jgi:hypothetical protein